eukprot:jgi/Mesvir1/12970/Mv05982-RA.1
MDRLWIAIIALSIAIAFLILYLAIRREEAEHREFQWKSVDGATTRLRLVSADGKLGLVEIVSSPEQSNHVPIEVQRASGVGVMDAETAVQTIRDKNAPDWTVAGGGPVGMSSAYET